MKHKVDIKLFQ